MAGIDGYTQIDNRISEWWKGFKEDFKERFLTLETFGMGPFFIAGGVIWLLIPQHLDKLLSWGAIGYGVYLVFVNRVKQKQQFRALEKKRRDRVEGE